MLQNTNIDTAFQSKDDSVILDPSANPYASVNNRLSITDKQFHDWYRFVLSFPPHLVRSYLNEFCTSNSVILDPFCGTGTTIVEAKLNGIQSIGIEANPVAHFASSTKISWDINTIEFLETANKIASETLAYLLSEGINDGVGSSAVSIQSGLRNLNSDLAKLILKDSISPLPLHKTLILREEIDKHKNKNYYPHLRLALAKAIVYKISNLKFGPEVGVGKRKIDIPVVTSWLDEVKNMVGDLTRSSQNASVLSKIYLGDSREIRNFVPRKSVDAVITSPPYPNEKDYTRTTRLESVLLGFISSKEELRMFKKSLIRSNTRGVYKEDDDYKWIEHNLEIRGIAEAIEKRRIELNKTSGFERLYGKVTKLYFGGMAKHLKELQHVLKPGARLAYVVGDQASYLRVMIRTGKILGDIAQELGYRLDRIDLFRTRFATATGEQLREEVVILTWPG